MLLVGRMDDIENNSLYKQLWNVQTMGSVSDTAWYQFPKTSDTPLALKKNEIKYLVPQIFTVKQKRFLHASC